MSSADKLSLEHIEGIIRNYHCDTFTIGMAKYSQQGMVGTLAKQLADTMRENERLEAERASLEKENEVMLQWLRKYHPRYKESGNG